MSRSQPRTVFVSTSLPSAFNFFREIISWQGRGSLESMGRANVLMAKGMAQFTRSGVSPMSGAIPIESSM